MSIREMSKLLIKSLLRTPSTRRYPYVVREPFAATRGGVDVDPDTCILCLLCQKKCPTGAITVDRPGKTWAIQRTKCIACGACVECCPKKSISMHAHWAEASIDAPIEVFPIAFTPPSPRPAATSAPPGASPNASPPTPSSKS